MSDDSSDHKRFNRLRRGPRDDLHTGELDPTAELPQTARAELDGGGYELADEIAEYRFPDNWGDDDVAFLASFVRENFGAHLVVAIDGGEADYRLFTEGER
jgi:hypothetical protein